MLFVLMLVAEESFSCSDNIDEFFAIPFSWLTQSDKKKPIKIRQKIPIQNIAVARLVTI